MFSSAANPYDELVVKATDENLASEDWALNLEVCDKVSGDGQSGARQAIGALQKRLSHRNPNVQLYALELANTLAQNCGKPLLEELSSRNWTSALDRLVNDRATVSPVKKKALTYIKAWAKQFEDTGDANLGLMAELYDQLRAKNFTFDEAEPAPESAEEARRRQEDEELQRVLELSKQDKGGRQPYQPSAPEAFSSGGSSSRNNYTSGSASGSGSSKAQPPLPYNNHQQSPPPVPEPEPEPVLDLNTATRVRALYTFTSAEVGELNFERGDVIKVLDRGFKEWWRGACNGKIGIFPVTYVEPVAEPSPRELQEEAQEEARVFASLGLVDQLLQTLKGIDPSRGDRLDDRPEIEEMYQASVGLQGQINALIKKYSDQKAELEHMNANFLRAMRQYEELRNPPPPPIGQGQPPYGYAPQAQQDPYAGQYQQFPQQQPQQQPAYAQQPSYVRQPSYGQPPQQAQQAQPAQYEAQPPYSQGQQQSQQQQSQQPQYSQQQQYMPEPHPAQQGHSPKQSFPQPGPAHHEPAPPQAQYYAQQHQGGSTTALQPAPSGAPGYPPAMPTQVQRQTTEPGAAGLGAGSDPQAEHKAAWDAYYRQQAEQQQQQQQQGYSQQENGNVAYGASPYPPAGGVEQEGGQPPSYAGHAPPQSQGVDGVINGVNRMTVHGS